MSSKHLTTSIRCCGGPVLFLVGVCLTIGIAFLTLGSDAGWIFFAAAGAALVAFGLLGAKSDMSVDLRRQRLPLTPKDV